MSGAAQEGLWTKYQNHHIPHYAGEAALEPLVRGGLVILIFRPQTLLSGTRHAPDTIKYDSGPRLPSGRVYSHLRGLYSRNFFVWPLFGRFWLGILLV